MSDERTTTTKKSYKLIEVYDEQGRLVKTEGYMPPEYRDHFSSQTDYMIDTHASDSTPIIFPIVLIGLLLFSAACIATIIYFSLPVMLKVSLGIFSAATLFIAVMGYKSIYRS